MFRLAGLDDLSVMRRKLAQSPAAPAPGVPGADRSWPVVLARAARDTLVMGLDVLRLDQTRVSLAELLEMPPDHALIVVLEGPGDGLGLFVISAPLLAAMTEFQTIGRVAVLAPGPRKPTRTDATMVAGFVDAALCGLEVALAEETDLVWAGGFRYASFMADPRPLGLLLEDVAYRVVRADISVEAGVRTGQILMALPAAGRGRRPDRISQPLPEIAANHAFTADLAAQIEGAKCVMQAVIYKALYPLSTVMGWQVGDTVPLTLASTDTVGLEGLDGLRIAEGRLGQNRGMRAVRVTLPAASVPGCAEIVEGDRPALAG